MQQFISNNPVHEMPVHHPETRESLQVPVLDEAVLQKRGVTGRFWPSDVTLAGRAQFRGRRL
ncbi:MAG: hypothetical protein ACOZDD_14945 [Bacteroidota bacterium]